MSRIEDWKWELVTKRIEAMPSHMKLAMGGGESFSKNDILQHINKRDNIGKRVVEMQLNYLKFMKEESERSL